MTQRRVLFADVENSFVLAPVTSFPNPTTSGGGGNAFEAALGPLPNMLREDSDPDKENMAPRPPGTSASGVGVKELLRAAEEPGWLTPGHSVASPPSVSGGALLKVFGDSNVATPPFLRQPAPDGVLDMLRRAGVDPQSPLSAPAPTTQRTCESRQSVVELLGGTAEKLDTPPFLRYLDSLDDDVLPQRRLELAAAVQKNDSISADMEITAQAGFRQQVAAAGSAAIEVSQMELTGSSTQTVRSPSGRPSIGQSAAGVVGDVDDWLDRGLPRVSRPAVGNRTVVDSTDMELTNALPRGLLLQPASSLRSVVDEADMELTAAVSQATAKMSTINRTIADGGDMEFTAVIPEAVQKPSSQLNKSIVEGADMELTAAVPRGLQKPSSQLNRSIVEGADMELTAAVPQEVQKPSSQLNKSIVEGADMELTAAVPREFQKPSSQLNRSIMEGADMELTAAVPQEMQKPSSQLNKSIVEGADMELTAAVPREMQKPSSQLNKSIVEGADMELTAAVPREVQKPSSQLNRSIVEGADMELTAAVPREVQKPSSQLNKSIVEGADMELTAVVPREMQKPFKSVEQEYRGRR